jgi:NADPH-dependent ferric siderophore reductase
VRSFDPASSHIDFDVAAHGDGLATRWLRQAAPSDVLALTGMRREFFGAPGVDRHLLIGDCSAVPAIAAIIESLPDKPPDTVVVAAEHASDVELIPDRADDRRIGLVDVNPANAGDALLRALAAESRPPGRIQAWVGGEVRFVRRARQLLLNDWQIARTDLQASAYWRPGQDATQVDAATVARYQSAMQRGLNLSDPDILDQLEFEG